MIQNMKCITLSFFSVYLISVSAFANSGAPLREALKQKASQSKNSEASSVFESGIQMLRDTKKASKALAEGAKLPEHEFLGGQTLKSFYQKGPLVLTFYRGHWCPYCMLELKEYQRLFSHFKELGAQIVAVSPDEPMQVRKTKDKEKLSFTLFSDPEHRLAKKMGVAFEVDEKTLKLYSEFGIDLKKSQGNSSGDTLPMPGTYVVDQNGEIIYAFVDPDYKLRAEPLEVLEVIQGL